MKPAPLRLEPTVIGNAGATVAALLFTVCALAVALAPSWTVSMAATLFHLDVTALAPSISWAGYFAGVVCWTVATWGILATTAALYNLLLRRHAAAASGELARDAGT